MTDNTTETYWTRVLRNVASDPATLIQIRFKNDLSANGAPLGPGRLEQRTVADASGATLTLYCFWAPVVLGGAGGRQEITLPMIFNPDDVLWISTGPVEADTARIVTRSALT